MSLQRLQYRSLCININLNMNHVQTVVFINVLIHSNVNNLCHGKKQRDHQATTENSKTMGYWVEKCILVLLYIWSVYGFGPSDVEFVHVVASNHFDAGYTNFTVDVLNEYFDDYIPSIPKIARE